MQIKAVTVLHSEMVRIQTIHLKNWAIKIDNWSLDFFFFLWICWSLAQKRLGTPDLDQKENVKDMFSG